MKTIWKHQIEITDVQVIEFPDDARIIHVGYDLTGKPCVWAEVETDRLLEKHTIYIAGTGRPRPHLPAKYCGTFLCDVFFWHVYADMNFDATRTMTP